MAHFINGKDTIVTEALDGFLWASGDTALARLDGFPGAKVVLNRKHNPNKVAVISGGGSGHEPAHAGFVGKGMLAAAICGEVFASPSVDAVLAGILAVTGKGGCLLIVKNYTGDRLNFGLAAEKARVLGKKVAMVVVADDVAIEGLPQPRGIAGTLLVHKIAGYHAEKGMSLASVHAKAQAAAKSVASIGVSLSSCNVPGNRRVQRIEDGRAEVGLGIHGEPGADLVTFESAEKVAGSVIQKLLEKASPSRKYVMLINNLGSTTPLEMNILAGHLLSGPSQNRISHVIGPAPLVTSLDMHGFSASLIPAKPDFLIALRAPVEARNWPGLRQTRAPKILPLPLGLASKRHSATRNATVEQLLLSACDAFLNHEDHLNELDSKIGDGDTGTTIATAAKSLRNSVHQLPLAQTDKLFSEISSRLLQSMGGSSGVLLAILFASASASLREGRYWPTALLDGLQKVKEYGGAKLGDRTMIDALEPALKALSSGKPPSEAALVARRAADQTGKIGKALAGRASYVPSEVLDGVIDPGAEAVAILFAALAQANQDRLKSIAVG